MNYGLLAIEAIVAFGSTISFGSATHFLNISKVSLREAYIFR
jgi:hypothetical protein